MIPQDDNVNEKPSWEDIFFGSLNNNDFEKNNFTEDDSRDTKTQQDIINHANERVLLETLSPEITKNESKKREHKDILIKIVQDFFIKQSVLVGIIVCILLIMILIFHAINNDVEIIYIKEFFKIIALYISSVIVELIAMLRYIVENVFDTSIPRLLDSFKENTSQIKNEQ